MELTRIEVYVFILAGFQSFRWAISLTFSSASDQRRTIVQSLMFWRLRLNVKGFRLPVAGQFPIFVKLLLKVTSSSGIVRISCSQSKKPKEGRETYDYNDSLQRGFRYS